MGLTHVAFSFSQCGVRVTQELHNELYVII